MPLGRLHGVEDVLQLVLVVEHGRAGEPLVHLSSHASIPRSRRAIASASTTGLSRDEWLMNTRMSGPRAALTTIDVPPINVAAGPMDAASRMIKPQSTPVKPLDRTAIRFQRPDPKRAGRGLGAEPLLIFVVGILIFSQ
jgi:hypothetical protein